MPVSLFEHKPQHCPFGHPLWPGQARVGWKPCICAAAREGAERGRGMGHLLVSCQVCHAWLRDATFYEPPHDASGAAEWSWLCWDLLLPALVLTRRYRRSAGRIWRPRW